MTFKDPTGILLVDKPKGITSFGVLHKIKKKFQIKKIGHAGTLDPDATGLLIVLLGAATKLQRYITDERKTYSGEIQLGISTNTQDSTGEVIETKAVPTLSSELIEFTLRNFLGEHLQAPPAFSAIKKDGVRAYALARKGEEVILEQRLVTLFDAEIRILDERTLFYRLSCSKGFYVRSFARDFALGLGTIGITSSIRREISAGVDITNSITLDSLLASTEIPFLPVTEFLTHLERVNCSIEEYSRLILGRSDVLEELDRRIKSNNEVLLLLDKDKFAGILGQRKDGLRGIEFLVPGLIQ